MKGIVYYNNKGKIFDIVWGEDAKGDEEAGIPFLEIDVPLGAVLSEVDLAADPPKIKFTKYPEDDYDILNRRVDSAVADISTTNASVSEQSGKISEMDAAITDVQLAIVSLYEGGGIGV